MNVTELLNKLIFLCLPVGLFILGCGIGAHYQAEYDVIALNNTLNAYADTNAIISDGHSFYKIHKHDPFNISTYTVSNLSYCNEVLK